MSRIGKKPITIPKGVTVKVLDNAVEVQGPKGKLKQAFPQGISFELADGSLVASGSADQSGVRSRIDTMVSGSVSPGNATRPVNISYSTQPNAQISDRLSTFLPRACSGLM